MTQVTQENTGGICRNTKDKSSANSASRARGWSLTFQHIDTVLIDYLKSFDCEVIAFQSEKGNLTGKDHIQCAIQFKNARTFSSVKKTFGEWKPHIEKSRLNIHANVNYCTKRETYNGGVRYYRCKGKVILNETEEQKQLEEKREFSLDEYKLKLCTMMWEDPAIRRWWSNELSLTDPEHHSDILYVN